MDVLDTIEDKSIDAIITDPPYELGFMGKKWDASGIAYNVELWKKALRVLKPGGYLLAFGGTRTFHRIACAIEDAGFEIRDCIMWLYGSGFPKSLNIGLAIDKKNGVESEVVGTMNAPDLQDVGLKQKALGNGHIQSFGQITNAERIEYQIKKASNQWNGWGTQLKPAYEPIIVAKKPVENSITENVIKYGVGGINIDECRVPYGEETDNRIGTDAVNTSKCGFWSKDASSGDIQMYKDNGRFPANIIHDGSEEAISGMPETQTGNIKPHENKANAIVDMMASKEITSSFNGDFGSASRYFYCAKAGNKDRDEGLDTFEEISHAKINGRKEDSLGATRQYGGGTNPYLSVSSPRKNVHPTVKPVELMQYLVRLVSPKGATILDIFNGSGSTGKAVAFENRERDANYKYIGIELEKDYCAISEARIDYALNKYEYDAIKEKKENEEKGQIDLFDFTWE